MNTDRRQFRSKVAYVFPTSHHFRVPFHELLRERLKQDDIEYQYVYSKADTNAGKMDTVAIDWAVSVPLIEARIGGLHLAYQHALSAVSDSDLVILQQQNNLLGNYPILASRWALGRKIGIFGHGRNFQARTPDSASERFKMWWSTKVDWWFAYTERCRSVVVEAGFPQDRVTVFNNSIDTTAIARQMASIDAAETDRLRNSFMDGSADVAVYIGGMYPDKRLKFLIEAADRIAASRPSFRLLVIGAGAEAADMKKAAMDRSWLRYVGPKFGREKVLYASLGRVYVMPGLVGLGVLDSFVFGLPLVTTNYPYHSPEIDYLRHRQNGLVTAPYMDVAAYADAVVEVLQDGALRQKLAAGARQSLMDYSIEYMVERFARGVKNAIVLPKR